MALRNIFREGDPILRKISKPVTVFDERLGTLLDDMAETMIKAEGCGIAAPQVGILKRAVIVFYNNEITEFINPVISQEAGEEIGTEGCLSVDNSKNCEVKRPHELTVTAFDRHGKKFSCRAEGWKARIICHECDHLNGILFIDKKYTDKGAK